MPSASLWLGYYVTTRPRADGTFRVLFEVPARLRPSGWPSQIPLPREGERTGNLDDAIEVYRIQQDAKALYEALQSTKGGDKAASLPAAVTRKGTIPWLIRRWGGQRLLDAVQGKLATLDASLEPGEGGRDEWLDLEPRTRRLYIRSLRPVFAWSITIGHKHVRQMRPDEVAAFLDMWKPGQRKNVRAMLSQLFAIAEESGELTTSPLDKVKIKKRKRVKGGRRKTAVRRWTRADVEFYATTARSSVVFRDGRAGRDPRPWIGGAILVRLMYETAADSTDVITWRKDEHLVTRGGVAGVEFDRGKTGVPTFIPISNSLAAEIRANGALYFVTDPFGRPYQPVVDDSRLRGHLTTLREQVVKAKGPHLTYDHLRHSAATEAVECGVPIDDTAHLTAHKNAAMNREVYVQRSADVTVRIQRARGIIE